MPELVRVGDIIELQRRPVSVESQTKYFEIGVRSFGRGIFHKEPVEGHALGKKRCFHICPGDLVLSNVFSWEGAIATASESDRGKIGSHRFLTYTPIDPSRVSARWLMYAFLSGPGLELVRRASPGSAGRNRTLGIERFENLEVPLIPIEEQLEIVSKLDQWSLLIRQIGDHLSAPSRTSASIARLQPLLVEKILSAQDVPYISIGDLVDIVGDVVRPGADPAPADCFVGLQHVESHTGRNLGSTPLGGEKGRKFRFMSGDIVFGYLRPYLNKVWLADRPGLCSVDQYVLRPRKDVRADLLASQLRSASVLRESTALTHNLQLPRLRSELLRGIFVRDFSGFPTEQVMSKVRGIELSIRRAVDIRHAQASTAAALMDSAINSQFRSLFR